jgi:uncharacterized caspase-like protein
MEVMARRFHNVWYQGIWGAIACIAVVCAAAGRDVFAMPNLRAQCFANEDPAALEACRSYVAESRFNSSDIIRLGRELEKQSLFKNAVVVYEQGLRSRPESNELRQRLQMAESLRNEAAKESTTPDPDARAKRLAKIACTQLEGARALEACQRATALDPDNATLYERLGAVLTGLGRDAEASQAYQNARRLGRVNAGSTGSVQATARPEQGVPSKPSAEAVPSDSAAVSAPAGKAPLSSSSRESNTLNIQLQMLDQLRKEGLISVEEYKERRAKLLDTVFTAQPISIPEQPARMDDDRTVLADVKLGNFYALVIGNDDYKNIPKLKSAIVDAKAVGTLLEKEYGFRVTSLFNASRYQILSALSGFRTKLSERDSFLIYYAGHGELDTDIQRGYWLPIDAEAKNSANWLSTTAILDEVHAIKALHVLVISDSCFSASLVRRGLVELDRANDQSNSDRHALIRRLAKKRSRTILTSGGLEPVLDSGGGQHSVFAKALLNTLHENQGLMEGTRLFQKLRELVVYNADQTPEYAPAEKAGHEGGDFIFVRQR